MDDPRAIGELLGGFLVVLWLVSLAALSRNPKAPKG